MAKVHLVLSFRIHKEERNDFVVYRVGIGITFEEETKKWANIITYSNKKRPWEYSQGFFK